MSSRRVAKIALICLGLVVGVWLSSSYVVAWRFTRRHHPIAPEPAPALSWGSIESLRLATRDGENLGAWFIDGAADALLVVFLHGNGACRSTSLPQAELLSSQGYGVLLVTLRAHGDSTGVVNDFGRSARHDVVAAVEWLEQNHSGKPVVVWGQSLGAAAAIFAAEELDGRVQGYILECPFQDLATVVRNRMRIYLPPLVDRVASTGVAVVSPLVLSRAGEISPLKSASRAPHEIRALILAGGADRRAQPDEARAIQQQWGSNAELFVVEGAKHLQLLQTDELRYGKAIYQFLEKCDIRREE